jgi:hypothetical protein
LPAGERLQVPQQRHRPVIVARPFGLDQRGVLPPGFLGPGGELVEVPGVGGSPGGVLTGLLLAPAPFLGLIPRGLAVTGCLPQLGGRPAGRSQPPAASGTETAQQQRLDLKAAPFRVRRIAHQDAADKGRAGGRVASDPRHASHTATTAGVACARVSATWGRSRGWCTGRSRGRCTTCGPSCVRGCMHSG